MKVPVIETERLTITLPGSDSAGRMARYLDENRAHFAPWSPRQSAAAYSEPHLKLSLLHAREELSRGQSARFVMFLREDRDGPVVGNVSYTEIVRGPLLGCNLGYKIGKRFEGQGLMFEALTATNAWVFDELGLHRIAAGYRPVNERSGRLLRRLGFTVEGYARDYLFIDGAWCDHILTALTNPAIRPPEP